MSSLYKVASRDKRIQMEQTIMRMGMLEKSEMKLVKFIMKKNGFNYKGFENHSSLRIIGSAIHRAHVVRFPPMRKSNECAVLWHTIKQNLENGFRIFFKLQIGKLSTNRHSGASRLSGTGSENRVEAGNQYCCSSIHLVIQNSREIKDDKPVPLYVHKLGEFLSVQIGVIESAETTSQSNKSGPTQYRGFIRVFLGSEQRGISQQGNRHSGMKTGPMKIGEYFFKEGAKNPGDGIPHTFK